MVFFLLCENHYVEQLMLSIVCFVHKQKY